MDREKNMCDRLWLVWVVTVEEILGLMLSGCCIKFLPNTSKNSRHGKP